MRKTSGAAGGDEIRAWLNKAHELRTRLFEVEVEFLLYLVEGESVVTWRGAWKSYESFLLDQRLCEPARYAGFRNAMASVSVEDALKVGVDGAIRAASISASGKREELLVELRQFAADTGHPPSRQQVNTSAQRIAPVERPGSHTQGAIARDKLREENDALRRQVSQLKAENAKLAKEVARLLATTPTAKKGNRRQPTA